MKMANRLSISDSDLALLAGKAQIELSRRDLGCFGEYVYQLACYPHIRQWVDALADESISNVAIICPPGHGKSSWIGSIFPSWILGCHPEYHILYLSSTASHAEKFSNTVRGVIASSKEYHQVFPHVKPDYAKGWST